MDTATVRQLLTVQSDNRLKAGFQDDLNWLKGSINNDEIPACDVAAILSILCLKENELRSRHLAF